MAWYVFLDYWWLALIGYAVAFVGIVAFTVRATLRDAKSNGGTFFDGSGSGTIGDGELGTVTGTDDDGDNQSRANLARALDRNSGLGPVRRPDGRHRLGRFAADLDSVRAAETAIR